MGQETKIEWTHHTLNVWRGCAEVPGHTGCSRCYAKQNVGVKMGGITWGPVWQGGQRVVKADSGWREPLKWARDAARAGERRRVFCASLADVLEVPSAPPSSWPTEERVRVGAHVAAVRAALDAARARLWDVIRETAFVCQGCLRPHAMSSDRPGRSERLVQLASVGATCEGSAGRCTTTGSGGLDWLLLTKRPENWRLVPEGVRPLVWLGTSISDQKTADEWVPRLLKAEGFRLRFLSVEPLVGPVDLSRWLPSERWFLARCRECGYTGSSWAFRELRSVDGDADIECPDCSSVRIDEVSKGIGWVITGGESGSRARPCDMEWVRDIVRQCHEAHVPCFVKQLGAITKWDLDASMPPSGRLVDKKGGDMSEWPEDLRVREFPEVHHA